MRASFSTLVVLSLLGMTVSSTSTFAQGDLTPPGPPAPTFRTLQQVEPRIPINGTTTPGDASSIYKITVPGSYYLTENITVTIRPGSAKQTAIEVAASNVTIDLNGFRINGNGAANSVNGIEIPAAFRDVSVRNGNIVNCGVDGLHGTGAQGLTIENVVADNNGTTGIVTGDHSSVRNCKAANNGSIGISVTSNCTVTDSQVRGNPKVGIAALVQCVISRCTVADANAGDGILAESFCVVDHCTVNNAYQWGIRTVQRPTISDCNVSGCGHVDVNGVSGGVLLHFAGLLRHSSISFNRVGVEILGSSDGGGCVVLENEIDSNTGGGVDCLSGGNRIDGNLIGYNGGPSVRTHESGNVIVRNHLIGVAMALGGKDMVGPVVSGTGSISGLAGGANPWANLQQ